MEDSIYTIKNLCDELNEPRQKVRRRLEKLEIKAINEYTRAYKNDPLKYDHQSFLKLAEEFDVQMDEPEVALDIKSKETLLKWLKKYKSNSIVIIISHNLELINFADHIINLS